MGTVGSQTIGGLLLEARTLLSDTLQVPGYRYADSDLIAAFNGAMVECRRVRPDLFLGTIGLRQPVPTYTMPTNSGTPFPLDMTVYNAFLSYIIFRCETREDTFTDDARAKLFHDAFVAELLSAAA